MQTNPEFHTGFSHLLKNSLMEIFILVELSQFFSIQQTRIQNPVKNLRWSKIG